MNWVPGYPQQDFDLEMRLLIEGIYLKYNYDFRNYSPASLKRRVAHAMSQLECATVSALQDKVLHSPQHFLNLLQFLTVPVSEMFRDPAYFLAVREKLVPILSTYPSLKIWIAGCSTGEEVYSLAILLHEEGLLERTLIYATDINPHSLQRAEDGIFPIEHLKLFTANYLAAGGRAAFSDYYTAAYGSAIFDRTLRRQVTFADHSLATDSVFSETQFISCRNVLIYFNRELQDRAFGLFRDSLCHRGFLGLGSKETVRFSGVADHFETFAGGERIFRKR
ncbi:protein-glutamate O-methyltransferase CheR [Chitiniphilus purpureus]|uniref:Protein-glutamate O-methyltransferase CheR n=1 Tax=Chitiniphilus purpureus TaxID=2981137 RepID=A0ABY6DNX3_9NEIS|nr:CheR family methyltransferase [Chitiniphilus sp. CD1]UXY15368.1 protein-glutamate O-methyltransferase CheR [Chitiniphilus sp. CD1]